MGIWGASILRGRRILPGVGFEKTSFGVRTKEVLTGGRINPSNSLISVELDPEASRLFLRETGGLVYGLDFDGAILWTSSPAYGNLPRIRLNRNTNVLAALGSRRNDFIDAATGGNVWSDSWQECQDLNPSTVDSTFVSALRESGKSANAIRYQPTDQSYDFYVLPEYPNGKQLYANAFDSEGRLFVGATSAIMEVETAAFGVVNSVTLPGRCLGRMLAAGFDHIAAVTDDYTVRCYSKDLEPQWARVIEDGGSSIGFYAVDVDIFGDVYLLYKKETGGSGLLRLDGKTGKTVVDFEEVVGTPHSGTLRDMQVFDDGRILSCCSDLYRLIEQV